jgi:hypothetical protein
MWTCCKAYSTASQTAEGGGLVWRTATEQLALQSITAPTATGTVPDGRWEASHHAVLAPSPPTSLAYYKKPEF